MPSFEFLSVKHERKVAEISLNRPDKANALNETLWNEIGVAMQWADATTDVRVVILRGEGSQFCAGIDFEFMASMKNRISALTEGRKQEVMHHFIVSLQRSISALETCRKPVITAIHGACYGGGIDLITASDIRHASMDAKFSVKEVDLAIVADVGTLQRLPRIVGEGNARELALTGRVVKADEAQRLGLINQLCPDSASLLALVREQAASIAEKSPLAVRGTKQILNYSRDHSVQEGLDYVAAWNAGMLMSEDLRLAMEAMMTKKKPEFAD